MTIDHRNVLKIPRVLLMTLFVSIALLGCIHQKPLNLPQEEALPPGESAFWQDLAAIRADDWFYLLNTGNDALQRRLNMIDVATVSIDMDTFLWKPDVAGLRILAHLVSAADRGVRVRIMLDDSFTMHEELVLHAADEHPNISYRIYNPFRHRSDSAVWRELFNLGEFTRINHRMHNKTLIVDGRMALVGGRNLGDEYFGLHADMNFRDMEVITAGSQVEAVTEQFDAFWNSGWAFPIDEIFDAPENAGSVDVLRESLANHADPVMSLKQLQADWLGLAKQALPGRAEFFFDEPADHNPADIAETPDQLAAELRELISSASSEVILVTAYLVPTPELETVVETVEDRGVEVRILTNSLRSNNHLAAHAAYSRHLHRLIGHGADLHEVRVAARDRELYMQQPVEDKQLGLHAKVMLVDDQITFIGSANLDPRSLKINTEVGLIIESPELNQQLREQLKIDFLPENAWAVKSDGEGGLRWEGHDQVLNHQPADSLIQRLEDWFIGLLPIDKQM